MSSVSAVIARVTGRVQGVGFRAATAKAARRLGLAGSVRNLSDGAVEVRAEGEPGALEALRAFLGRGPTFARVDEVSWRAATPRGLEGFAIERDGEVGEEG